MSDDSRRDRGLLWLLLVAAAVLRAVKLDAPLWFDEIWLLVDTVRLPFGDLVSTYESDNNHPLYSALAWLSTRAFGESAWTLRLPAAAFGVAGVWALHVFARDRLGQTTALLAAALLAFSFVHIGFSQNARAYTGLLFLALLSSHYFLEALDTGERKAWVAHGVTLALCTYLHLTGVFVAVGQVAVLLVAHVRGQHATSGKRAAIFGLALAVATSLLLHALILGQMVHFFFGRPKGPAVNAEWTNPLWMLTEAMESVGLSPLLGFSALLIATVVLVVGLVRTWRREPAIPILFVVPAVVVAVAMLALGRNLWPRLFFFVAGFALLVGIEGVFGILAFIVRPKREDETTVPVKIAAGLMVMAAWLTAPRAFELPKQDYPAALQSLERMREPGEPVVAVGLAAMPYARYHDTDFVSAGATGDEPDADAVATYEAAVPPGARGWLVYTFPIFTQSRHPELWTAIQRDGIEVARFRGSLGGGDLVVLRIRR